MPDPLKPEWTGSLAPGPTLSFLPQIPPYSSSGFRNDESPAENSKSQCTGNPEHAAIEWLAALKKELRVLDLESFWCKLLENTASLCNAQYAFVARRLRSDEAAKEIGGHKPSLFGTAFYYNDGFQNVGIHRHRYFAGGNPHSHMDLKQPCLIPDNLSSYISFDKDKLPFPAEGYLAIPLFSGDECLAFLGLMWSDLGLQNRTLSWSFLETVLFSLEDLVVQRIQEDRRAIEQDLPIPKVSSDGQGALGGSSTYSHSVAGFASQHLKPFARSLSHELRTPMQGIVGMLDVMHATVREALVEKPSPRTAYVFQSLKESIEMVQDSARRAVEAADNVVHAYDLNMEVPKTPQVEQEDDLFGLAKSPAIASENKPNLFIEGSNITVNPYKRRKSNPLEKDSPASRHKVPRTSSPKDLSPRAEEVKNAVHESDKIFNSATPAHQMEAVMASMVDPRPSLAVRRSAPNLLLEGINLNIMNSALRSTKLRDLLRLVVNESLHVGGRPDLVVSTTTEVGEKIEVQSRSSNGEIHSKTIDWSVDNEVPDALLVDDRDLAKLISCVFLNAVKFTNNGLITVKATINGRANDILINVRDTGPGIPIAFLPNLFKPFARKDTSLTRSKDGLGLGLLVAKGLARKLGGDLVCVRSSTSGADHGSEFEIRVPLNEPEALGTVASSSQLSTPTNAKDPSRPSSASNSTSDSTVLSPLLPLSQTPMQEPTPAVTEESSSRTETPTRTVPNTRLTKGSFNGQSYDSRLGEKYPLTFLVAEDNKINRRVLVHMLKKLGYQEIYEASNGKEAVHTVQNILESQGHENGTGSPRRPLHHEVGANEFRIPESPLRQKKAKLVDVILMDLWMPEMDGYEATSRIFKLIDEHRARQPISSCFSGVTPSQPPTILAVSADVTDESLSRASKVGMRGYMTKPYRLVDLERLIEGFCSDAARQANYSTNA
ncbi:uncharacterized protein BJX67DRAFT_70906 [Aspergillus lucknowensis]|uniref:histidine kinase n=1 Tax=Aspergillus lucknowensis TaxID=176173 RepID=A0ABR4LTS4_9EURO